VLLPGSFLPGVAEGSVSRLAEHALVAALASWTKFDEQGSICISPSMFR
jgi:hypothetical protein